VTESVRDSIVVDASPAAVMAVIRDFAAYPQWQAEVRSAEVLTRDAHGRGTTVRFLLDAKFLRTTLVLAYRHSDHELRWSLVEGDQLRRDDGSYALEELGDGRTRVEYALEVEPAVRLPALVRRTAARRLVDAALHAMRRRVESRPPPHQDATT
jgi:ribosome-associated toxin RatA of RatAB toxin-antitoxin module